MSAALGVSQLKRIEDFLKKREKAATLYGERLAAVEGVRIPIVQPHVRMSWFVYVATLQEGIDRDGVMKRMEEAGIPTRAYFPPIHRQPYMRTRRTDPLPVTESVAARTIALPFHNNLTVSEIDRVVDSLSSALKRL
jgi:perosamine synthetase